ncbi:MAG TPA: hypothetical protein VHG91_06400 [Longimicrobium sp.]|nr:hypothetical protein [Longimicrobium sp.]
MSGTGRTARGTMLALAALLAGGAPLRAQEATRVTAGPEYRAGGLKAALLGRDYRDLWTTPATVEVLDLGTFAGGLTPTETGGGNQTLSLRFRGADGREYAFRSVNKEQGRGLGEAQRGTLLQSVLQDQVSSLVPGGPLVSDALETAAGILHPGQRLFVMPDDPRLGEFRQEFAGMLGMMEERPDEGATGDPVLRRAAKIESGEDFFEEYAEGPTHRLDSRAYLTARLVDFLFNDWDRHEDQFRWARFDTAGVHLWRPVPRDRDYVFVDYDGLLPGLARRVIPNVLRYNPHYKGALRGLTMNSEPVDRRLLSDLPRGTWDSTVAALQARLSDAVIDDALRRLPPEYLPLQGPALAATIRARRDRLPEIAQGFYLLVNREAEIFGKETADAAEAERFPDGGVEVRLFGAGAREPYFVRRFETAETREVRIRLSGGDDRARVYGTGPEEIIVRVIGGDGDDAYADETRGGHAVAFYDHRGADRFSTRPGTRVDRREYEPPPFERGGGRTPPREGGIAVSLLSQTAAWKLHAGPVVGVGPSATRFGFRRFPYATRKSARLLYAPLHDRFGVEAYADWRYQTVLDHFDVRARVSDLEASGFYGYGNDTPETDDFNDGRVWERQAAVEPTYHFVSSPRARFWLGATARWSDPDARAGTPAGLSGVLGTRELALAGARAGFRFDRRGPGTFVTRGWTLEAAVGGYPFLFDEGEKVGDAVLAFADARALGTAYLTLGGGPTLALRAGGQRVWGSFPLQYAAFLGGSPNLRGFPTQRFAGDAAVHGSAELRQRLFRTELVLNGHVGVLALADAGRVWYDGESDGDWHTALGGGAFFTVLEGGPTVTVTYARGERGIAYLSLGVPF